MDKTVFNGLLKDLVTHLYDYAALETHPLAALIEPPQDFRGRRGEYLRQVIFEAIEDLRPPDKSFSLAAPEWRPYTILHQRYVEGLSPQALAAQLAISERQMRRDHSRALQALAGRLWEQWFARPHQPAAEPGDEPANHLLAFDLHPEALALEEVLQGVVNILQNRLQAENIHLQLEMPPSRALALADRVILRQVLFSLFNYAVHLQSDQLISVRIEQQAQTIQVCIAANVDEHWTYWDADEHDDLLGSAKYWGQKINAEIEEIYPPSEQPGSVQLRLSLPAANQFTILVVDDQDVALKMYQRYLSRSDYKVVGVTDPSQVLPVIRRMQPALVLLDVMMPHIDGWEVLQALKSDTQTQHIPVIVCSAWEAADLAISLGAAEFLKKPITQKTLLSALEALNLPPAPGLPA